MHDPRVLLDPATDAVRRLARRGYALDTSALEKLLSARNAAIQRGDEARAEAAATFCRAVRIVVGGGFNPAKIRWFEQLHVPADVYGVGTSILTNDEETNSDFAAEIVRVAIGDEWYGLTKAGRYPGDNPDLEPVNLGEL